VELAGFIYFAALPLLMVSAGPAKKLKEQTKYDGG
jgi:hypothetical protein